MLVQPNEDVGDGTPPMAGSDLPLEYCVTAGFSTKVTQSTNGTLLGPCNFFCFRGSVYLDIGYSQNQ